MKKVSVIVPFYNVEGYIEKCLETLVNQTLQEIEIVLVNDGSTDRSDLIVQRFIKQYPDKIVYLKKENGGLSDARNFGMKQATGEYIAFLDSDDYVEKDMYQKMYDLAKRDNSDMVECDFYWEYPNKKKKDEGQRYNGKKEMIEKIRVVAWNKLIKREILENSKIEFPLGYHYEDVEFTYKLITKIDKVSFLTEPCVHYVQREGSISNTKDRKVIEIFDVLEHVIEYYKEQELYEEYKVELEYIYVRYAFCSSFLRIIKMQDEELKDKYLEKTWENVHKKFPDWKKNEILKNNRNLKNFYLKTLNEFTYKLYALILEMF